MGSKIKKAGDKKVAKKLEELQSSENRARPGERTVNSGQIKQERDIQGGGGSSGGGGGRKKKGKPTNTQR